MKKYKAIFLSDIHLGSPHCQSEKLFRELKKIEAQNLFLVGDIITQNAKANNKDIVKFIELINSQNWNITYILGNHEKDRRATQIELCPINPLKTHNHYIYNNGKQNIYITHGDSFHSKDIFNRILKYTLSKAKRTAQKIEDNKRRGTTSTFYHKRIKPIAQKYLHNSYIKYLTKLAHTNDCQSIICGHIHLPEVIKTQKATYLNCGDWINNSSYIVENFDGEFTLIEL